MCVYCVLRCVCVCVCVFRAAPQRPPASIRVLLIEERTALVSWQEPEQPGVVVGRYTVLYATHTAWLAGEWQILQREGETLPVPVLVCWCVCVCVMCWCVGVLVCVCWCVGVLV